MANAKAEKLAERIGLSELSKVMRAAQVAIKDKVQESITNPSMSQIKWEQRSRQVSALYATIRNVWAQYANKQFTTQYKRAKDRTIEALKKAGVEIRSDLPQYNTLSQMIVDSVARMNLATKNGEENVLKLFRDTQQAHLSDIEINRKLAEGLITGENPDNLKKVLKSSLAKSLGEGNVIEINGRKYKPDYYAELVARTRTREAQSRAAIDTIMGFGEDTVRVSSHNTGTPLCQEYEGNVYSLSGRSPHPILDQYPPFHPNSYHPDMLLLLYSDNGPEYVRAEDAYNNRAKYLLAPALDPYSMLAKPEIYGNQIVAWFRHKPDEWYDIKGDGFRQIVTWNHNIPVWSIDGIDGQRHYEGFKKAYVLSKCSDLFVAVGEGMTNRLIPVSDLAITVKPANQYAYCLDVGGHHCLLVKYEDSSSWSGNCQHVLEPVV